MKNTLFAFLAFAISVGAHAQKKIKLEDNTNASNFYFNNGKVGIGISTPTARLDVKGYTKLVNPSGRTLIVEKDDDDSWLTFHDPGQYWYSTGIDRSNAGAFNINFGGELNSSQFVMDQNGNVGIGASTPAAKLDVKGATKLVNPSGRTLIVEKDDDDSWLTFHDPGQYWFSAGIDRSNAGAFNINFGGELNSSQFVMDQNGNVGIGTPNPGTWKLAVNGKIRAKEISVETGWADFVFDANYDLPTLLEVENHIKKNGHLKDIPSAKEVAENGIFLGKMNTKLLQKIEELTLYTIQQQKEIQNLKRKNEELKSLSQRLSEIERLLKPENRSK
ncbi:hypothetical protein D1816_15215 [Aquimarina sp. AD10]|uniref:hypothetical protein n=1 Tax=Aquimarina sp. AD10 TaxID=1714849 RepID=UPI000E4B6E29|nr:hypothetical protein [Aquimarina sp. AD10]AXT61644.1 hypothetical protein D1816_15215 [Aquimarina sp. AD10]RKN01007.1 hypothetical protein D7033_06550 [Aquimarina sp. AD10]